MPEGAYEIGAQALKLIANCIRPVVERQLAEAYPSTWRAKLGLDRVAGSSIGGPAGRSPDDPNHLLAFLAREPEWSEAFRPYFGGNHDEAQEARDYAYDLRRLRAWYAIHRPDFLDEDAWRLIDSARRLLRLYGVLDAATADALTVLSGGLELGGRSKSPVADGATRERDEADQQTASITDLKAAYLDGLIGTTSQVLVPGAAFGIRSAPTSVKAADVYVPPTLTLDRRRQPRTSEGFQPRDREEVEAMSRKERQAYLAEWSAGMQEALQRLKDDMRSHAEPEPQVAPSDDPALLEVLRFHRLVIVGAPGSGKSTFLRYVAHGAALGILAPLAGRLPIILPVSRYAAALSANAGLGLRQFLVRQHTERYGRLFEAALEDGSALVLLDGIDEAQAGPGAGLVLSAISAFVEDHPNVTIFAATRPAGFRPESLALGFEVAHVKPLETAKIERICRGWGAALLRDGRDLRARDLVAQIHASEPLRELASNPLLLTLIVLQWADGSALPRRRVDLYEAGLETLLGEWPLHRLPTRLDVGRIRSLLEPIAYGMVMSGLDTIGDGDLADRLAVPLHPPGSTDPEEGRAAARAFIDMIEIHTGFLICTGRAAGERRFAFLHRTFAEYLAARHMHSRWLTHQLDLQTHLHRRSTNEAAGLFFALVRAAGREQASRLITEIMGLDWSSEPSVGLNLRLVCRLVGGGIPVDAPTLRAVVEAAGDRYLLEASRGQGRDLVEMLVALAGRSGTSQVATLCQVAETDAPRVRRAKLSLRLAIDPGDRAALRTAVANGYWTLIPGVGGWQNSEDRVYLLRDGASSLHVAPAAAAHLESAGVRVATGGDMAALAPPVLWRPGPEGLTAAGLVLLADTYGSDLAWIALGDGQWERDHEDEIQAFASSLESLSPNLGDLALKAIGFGPAQSAWLEVFSAVVESGTPSVLCRAMRGVAEGDQFDNDTRELLIEKLTKRRARLPEPDDRIELAVDLFELGQEHVASETAVRWTEVYLGSDADPRVRGAVARLLLASGGSSHSVFALMTTPHVVDPVGEGSVDEAVQKQIISRLAEIDRDDDVSTQTAVAAFFRSLCGAAAMRVPYSHHGMPWRIDTRTLGDVAVEMARSFSDTAPIPARADAVSW